MVNPSDPAFRGGCYVVTFAILPPLKGEVPSRRFTVVSEAEGFVNIYTEL